MCFRAQFPFDDLPKGRSRLGSRVAALTERYAPHAIPRCFGQASIRQQGQWIQHHVELFFLKRSLRQSSQPIGSVERTTIGECGLQVDRRVSVWNTAKESTIHVLVQPEQEPAQPMTE